MPAGQPTKYKKEYVEQAFNLGLLGLKDTEIATVFGVKESTLNNWKKAHPEFLESLVDGKENADAKVVRALYRRATGYEAEPEIKTETSRIDNEDGEGESVLVRTTTTTKTVPPEARAAQYWLNNRQGNRWANKQEVTHSGEIVYNCDYGPKESKT